MKKFFKNISWTIFGNGFSSLAKWLVVILIAKLLSAKDVGVYSLAFALTAPITLFANMKLRSLFVTDSENRFSNYIVIRHIFNFGAIIIFLIIGAFFYREYLLVILLVGISKILDLNSDIYYSYPHKLGNLDYIGKTIIIKNIILIIVFYISIILTNNLVESLLIMTLSQVVIFLIEKNLISKKFDINSKPVNKERVINILKLGLPLGVISMIYTIITNVPRYVLEFYYGATILGYFAAIMYIVTASNLFLTAISQVFLPRLSKLYKEQNIIKFRKYLYNYLLLITFIFGVLFTIFIFIFGEEILYLLYGGDYVKYHKVFFIVVLAVTVNMLSSNLDIALIAIHNIRNQLPMFIFNLFIAILFSMFLVKSFGIYGAAISLLLSYLILFVLRLYILEKKLRVDYKQFGK
ncbi:O-unit flippase Wzx [Lysinibacillus sp. PLM2]|nr:O-unit flippase Wzx [Lysinibacillus sp. PLM2]